MTAVEALLAAYPDRFTSESARAWVLARRGLLLERLGSPIAPGMSASSGCAASGARKHADELATDAAHALERLEAGLGPACEQCGSVLPLDRLDAAPAAVRCTGCARAYALDTRWCR